MNNKNQIITRHGNFLSSLNINKEEIKNKEEKKLEEAKNIIEKIKNLNVVFSKEADEKDQLYGSISKKEILEFLNSNNIKVKSDDLQIKEPIKSLGEHEIEVSPYVDVSQTLKVVVNKN